MPTLFQEDGMLDFNYIIKYIYFLKKLGLIMFESISNSISKSTYNIEMSVPLFAVSAATAFAISKAAQLIFQNKGEQIEMHRIAHVSVPMGIEVGLITSKNIDLQNLTLKEMGEVFCVGTLLYSLLPSKGLIHGVAVTLLIGSCGKGSAECIAITGAWVGMELSRKNLESFQSPSAPHAQILD